MLNEKEVKTKHYLQQIYRLDSNIRKLLGQAQFTDDQACSVPTVDYSKVKVSASHSGTAHFENYVIKSVDLRKRIENEFEAFCTVKAEAHECLNDMQRLEQRLVLTLRYIHFMLWEDIVKEMDCEERQVFRLHKEGLTELSEILTAKGII